MYADNIGFKKGGHEMRLHFFFMLLSGLVLSGGAVAAPATYTLPVVAMVDSNGDPVGTITGSFVYDIGTEQVSSHNITAVYNGTTYSPQVLGTPVDTTNSVVWARFMVANEVGAFGVYIPVAGLLEGGEGEVGGAAQMGYGDCLSLDGNGLCEWITPVHGYSPKSYSLVSPVSPPSVPVPTLPFYVLLALGGLVGLFGLRKLKK
jgi:hypothetical protein